MQVLTSKDMRVAGAPAESHTVHRSSWWKLIRSPAWSWHRPFCDALSSVMLEFAFASREGFPSSMERIPTVQICQVHTIFVPSLGTSTSATSTKVSRTNSVSGRTNDNNAGKDRAYARLVPKRVARIRTYQIGAAFSASECHDKANVGVILAFLAAKAHAIQRSAKSTTAASHFLTEWLVNLMTRFQLAQHSHQQSQCDSEPSPVDMELETHPRLRWLTRYVFGLLNSRGLARISSVHPDIQTFTMAQFSCVQLAPTYCLFACDGGFAERTCFTRVSTCCRRMSSEQLCKAVYPQLLAFSDLNDVVNPQISLSHVAMRKRCVVPSAYERFQRKVPGSQDVV